MASIAEDFGRGVIDCTTRQCFQIHWIRLENIPEIFDRLERVGMTTSGACGDITRNVVGCTLAGLAHDEIVDGYATSEAIHDYFLDNKLYSNLPRKYKVSVTGCAEDCARGLINDIALSARDRRGRHARLQPARRRRPFDAIRASPAGWTSSSTPGGGARGDRRG